MGLCLFGLPWLLLYIDWFCLAFSGFYWLDVIIWCPRLRRQFATRLNALYPLFPSSPLPRLACASRDARLIRRTWPRDRAYAVFIEAIMEQKASELLEKLLSQYPPVLGLDQAGDLLNFRTVSGVRSALATGRFPVRVRWCAGRLVVFMTDLVEYLVTGIHQEQDRDPQPPEQESPAGLSAKRKRAVTATGRRRGRPKNVDRMAGRW